MSISSVCWRIVAIYLTAFIQFLLFFLFKLLRNLKVLEPQWVNNNDGLRVIRTQTMHGANLLRLRMRGPNL
jgi:hypothetical protein